MHIGGHAQVYVLDEGLKLRAGKSTSYQIIENLPKDTIVTLLDGPQDSNGYTWWKVLSPNGNRGWVVEAADGLNTLIPLD